MDENYLRYYLQYAQGIASVNAGNGVISMKEKYYKDFSLLYTERILSYIEQAGGIAGGLAALILAKNSWKKGALLGLLSGVLYVKGRIDSSSADATLGIMQKGPIDLNVSSNQSNSQSPIFLPPPSPLRTDNPSGRPSSYKGDIGRGDLPENQSDQLSRPLNVIINNNIAQESLGPRNSNASERPHVYLDGNSKGPQNQPTNNRGGNEPHGKVKVLNNREDIRSQAERINNSLSDEITIQ